MSYNNNYQQQLQDLSRQFQQLNTQYQNFQSATIPQPQQITIPTPPRQVQYVEGIGGAKLYQDNMPPNSSEIIMDKNENIFYHVSKDANGTLPRYIPIGRFTLEEPQQSEEPAFLTRKDLDEFKDEIRQLLSKQTIPAPSKIITTSS